MRVIIVGSGVAGLLLCEALLRGDRVKNITLIAPSEQRHPRFLSYWTSEPTPFDSEVLARFKALEIVTDQGLAIPVQLAKLEYRTLGADTWFEARMRELLQSERVQQVDAVVQRVTGGLSRVQVTTTAGEYEADWAFVSGDVGAKPDYFQHFCGWEVELTDAIAMSSSGAVPSSSAGLYPSAESWRSAKLMDFRTPQGDGFRFCYVLPLGERRLFVEHVSHDACEHETHLERYLTQTLGLRQYRLVAQEHGKTPLYRHKPQRVYGRAIGIGVGAGLAKFCTGYAITRMWRDAEQIARGLELHGEPRLVSPMPSLSTLADKFFADALETQPQILTRILPELFRHAPGDAVLQFLDDRASLKEQARVARAMPEWVRWLFRSLGRG